MPRTVSRSLALIALSLIVSGALAATSAFARDRSRLFERDSLSCRHYDGVSDDLLTAGLGRTGLQSAVPPTIAVPTSPTAAELRRLAIYINYRALVDMTTNGGYGVLYGPNIDLNGGNTLGEGKIAGEECIAYADDGSGRENVTMMVQIPKGFNPKNACIVAAPSSGSRGVYGAIGTTGEWGLKRGCAVAYTDKGNGNGAHDLQNNTINLIDGVRADAVSAGTRLKLHGATDGPRTGSLQRRVPEPLRLQACALRTEPGEGLGPRRPAVDPLRLPLARRALRPAQRSTRPIAHDRHCVERVERWRGVARRGRTAISRG